MASLATILASERAELAWVLEIEGYGQVWTTTADTSGISTAWTARTGTTVAAGMEKPSSVTRSLDLLGFKTSPVNTTVRLSDPTAVLAALFGDDDTTAVTTYCTLDVDRDDTTIHVKSTSSFSSPIYIGNERITYSGSTGTSFTGCTRGTFAYAGKTAWAHTHRLSTNGGKLGPEVSTKPRVWANRGVSIYVTAKDPDTNVWITRANAQHWFAGYLQGWSRSGEDKLWSLDVVSVEKRLDTSILRDQFVAEMDGFTLPAIDLAVGQSMVGSSSSVDSATFTLPAGHYTLDGLLLALNNLLDTASLTWKMGLALVGDVIRMSLMLPSATDGAYYTCYLAGTGDTYYGFDRLVEILGEATLLLSRASGVGAQSLTRDGGKKALRASWNFWKDEELTVGNWVGTWANQQTDDVIKGNITGVEGLLQIGDSMTLWAVSQNGTTFTRKGQLDLNNAAGGWKVDSSTLGWGIHVAVGEAPLTVRQVWAVQGRTSRHLLRMLLSTGTSTYNNSTYDKWPSTMGLGIPSTVVDVESIEAVDSALGAAAEQMLVLFEPVPAAEEIHSFMASLGFALIWKNGKLTARLPTTPAGLPAEWTLNESNKGNRHGTDTDDGSSLIVNEFTLRFNRVLGTDEYLGVDVYHNLPSQHELDETRGMEYKARSLYDEDGSRIVAWRKHVAAPLAAYFGRAIRRHKRSGSRALLGIAPGDTVTWTDDDAPNQRTAAYGMSGVKAWVTEVTYDPETAEHDLTLIVPSGKFGGMSPVAMLDYSRGDAGWDSANLTAYFRQHEFSLSTEDVDIANFEDWTWTLAGAYFRIVEVDPATPAGAQEWSNFAVVSVDVATNSAVINNALTGFSTSKRYYLEFDDYAGTTAAQNATAYIGDDVTQSIIAKDPVYRWGSFVPTVAAQTPSGTVGYKRPDSLQDDDGEPMNARKLRDAAQSLNNAYAHTTTQQPISRQFVGFRTTQSTTPILLAGPFVVFCPPGVATLNISLHAKYTNAAGGAQQASFTVTASPTQPTGSAANTVTHGAMKEQTTITTASASTAIITGTLAVHPGTDDLCYVTVEGFVADAADTAHLAAISAWFAPRTIA